MGRISRFLELPPKERWLLLKTWALVGVVRLSLWMLPFPCTRWILRWLSRPAPRLLSNPSPIGRLAWAVEMASCLVPGATHCLTQALVTQILLVRHGYPAELCFGVMLESTNRLVAHAWVESQGRVVIGGSDLHSYKKLASRPVNLR